MREVSDPDSNGHGYTNRDAYTNADSYPNSNGHTYRDTDGNSEPNCG